MKRIIASALALGALCALLLAAAATAQPERLRGHHRGPMNVDRLADYLSLTEAQKTQVEQLREKMKQSLEPLFEEHRRLAEEVHAALESNADAATVGTAVIAAHEHGKKLRAVREQHDAELEALLTPAQLSRWRALKEARKLMPPPIPGLGGPSHD
jgi:Spy/CpxP family protein refolding chaperone